MFVAIGWIVVIGSVIGSFVGVGGHVPALLQPFELLCIFGAALGAFVVSNPVTTLKKTLKTLPTCFKGGGYTKQQYVELIALLYELLQKARRDGMMALEADVDAPEQSPLFQKYSHVLEDHHLLDFIVDYLRMMSSGNVNVLEMQDLMDEELHTHHAEASVAANAIQKMADGLPAFGIVAAVMGVVHTMAGRRAARRARQDDRRRARRHLPRHPARVWLRRSARGSAQREGPRRKPFQCVKAVLLASMSGYAPPVAVEFGRKVLFTADRPSFKGSTRPSARRSRQAA